MAPLKRIIIGATLSILAVHCLNASAAPQGEGWLRYVNILQGTDSSRSFSHGNTLPLIGPPWAMTDWSPQTSGDTTTRWFYNYSDRKILGFRATHQPSPWVGDYGHFMIMPETGPLIVAADARGADYDRDASIHRPDYLRIALPRYGVTVELTSSERCGVFRIAFANVKEGRLLIDPSSESVVQFVGRRFQGFSRARAQPKAENFATYFVGELDRDIVRSGTFASEAPKQKGRPAGRQRIGGYVEFATAENPVVEVRIATSFISLEQAARNLASETQGGFDAVRLRTAAAWEENLKRITIEATEDQKRTFYTCLYRALKYPHRSFELDAAGRPIHASPWDGQLHDGMSYTDSGLWDTYRTQFPFYSVAYPERLGEIVAGWLNSYRESGWLPQWPSPAGFGGMIGTHADAMIADALVKGIDGFDRATAYEAIRKDAFAVPGPGEGGRAGMQDYLKLGYVTPSGSRYCVSTGLDYAIDDWCVAQAAKLLGKTDDYRELMVRAQSYRKNWDPAVGFMRARKADGSWAEAKFDEFAWGAGYCEGGPWQCSWAVPHDAAGLAELLGGRAALTAKLDQLFQQPPTFHSGGYGSVIHEMSEMAAVSFGQCALSNQPSFHVPFLYAAAGQPWKTEFWTRKACAELYNSGPQGYAGDEDNGSAASWYILSTLGFYPLTPGHPTYVLTSPAFQRATIHLAGGRTFVVSSPGNDPKKIYVGSRTLNGQPLTKTWISHQAIVSGGALDVDASDRPHERVVADEDLPYSASNGPR